MIFTNVKDDITNSLALIDKNSFIRNQTFKFNRIEKLYKKFKSLETNSQILKKVFIYLINLYKLNIFTNIKKKSLLSYFYRQILTLILNG